MKKPSICLVNYEEGLVTNGILSKYAYSMEKELKELGYKVTVKNEPDPKADINHHINYIAAKDCKTLNTTMVTHFTSDMFDMEDKLGRMKKFTEKGGIGICFSDGVADYLATEGIKRKMLKTVLPAHDSLPRRPRFIMIAFKIYPDGRKREEMFVKLFRSLKDKKKFIFRIIGPGWRPIIEELEKEGIQLQWCPEFNLELYKNVLNTSDYLLYTGGEDAAAQCLIDAKQAALRIIAPKVSELEVDMPWSTQEELNAIFAKLEENPVEDWTWKNYTLAHTKIWEDLYKSSLKRR